MNIDSSHFFAALANDTRQRCLYLVATNEDVCVCEVVAALDIPQPSASKALRALKDAGFLCDRKEANWNYFRLNDAMPDWARAVVAATIKGLGLSKIHMADQQRFKNLNLRGAGAVCE
ncbi:MAG: ArsR family transcriptional regulator [Oceanicoccus sp.]|jgi:ArsR family transcriptional regulator